MSSESGTHERVSSVLNVAIIERASGGGTEWGSIYFIFVVLWMLLLETFLVGALYREFREVMRILTTFLGKAHRNPSELVQTATARNTRIMMDFCGFFPRKVVRNSHDFPKFPTQCAR